VCNSGVGLTPIIDGTEHHFSAGGLYNGLILLIDDETRTYWDHITGAAVLGPLEGTTLPSWPLRWTTVGEAAGGDPSLQLCRPRTSSPLARIMSVVGRRFAGRQGFLPPGFKRTMEAGDPRLPELSQGLGVMHEGRARFYPSSALQEPIVDDWGGRALRVALSVARVPEATWADDGEPPMQLFTRWYGFSFTFPGCEVYGETP
jgi:hypothetical protein